MKPISFVIITYNRPTDALELLQNISHLNRASELLEDVVMVNNASTESYTDVKNFTHPDFPLKYIDAPENLGEGAGTFGIDRHDHRLVGDQEIHMAGGNRPAVRAFNPARRGDADDFQRRSIRIGHRREPARRSRTNRTSRTPPTRRAQYSRSPSSMWSSNTAKAGR